MMNLDVEIILDINGVGDDLTAEVNVDFAPGLPAQLYGPPENCYPAEPAEVDVLKATVTLDDGVMDITEMVRDDPKLYDRVYDAAIDAAY